MILCGRVCPARFPAPIWRIVGPCLAQGSLFAPKRTGAPRGAWTDLGTAKRLFTQMCAAKSTVFRVTAGCASTCTSWRARFVRFARRIVQVSCRTSKSQHISRNRCVRFAGGFVRFSRVFSVVPDRSLASPNLYDLVKAHRVRPAPFPRGQMRLARVHSAFHALRLMRLSDASGGPFTSRPLPHPRNRPNVSIP